MPPIKIALCITELNIGGAEKNFAALVRGLNRDLFEPEVYLLRSRSFHQDHSYLKILEKENIPLHFLEIDGPISLLRGIFRMGRLLKKQRAEILQSFLFHANFVSRLAGKAAGVPVIFSGIRVSEKSARTHLLLDHWTSPLIDRTICVSRSVAEFTRLQGKIPADKIRIITNGLPAGSRNDFDCPLTEKITDSRSDRSTDPFSEQSTENLADRSIGQTLSGLSKNKQNDPARPPQKILFAGRLTRQKGLDWLLSSVSEWLTADRDLYLAGDGEDRGALEKQAQEMSCADRIHFLGWRGDIPKLMKEADLFVLPSRWEGMPNVVMEAMNGSLPVLCSRADGIEELLGEELGQTQICDFGDTEDFIRKIRDLLTEDDAGKIQRADLGKKNRQRIQQNFLLSDKIKEYENNWLEVYRQKTGRN